MISAYEQMEQFACDNGISIVSHCLPAGLSGHYYLNEEFCLSIITLDQKLDTIIKKTCVLAEELEHYISTPENLFVAPKSMQEKYENIARLNAVKKLMPLDKLIDARRRCMADPCELADYLNVTMEFLLSGLKVYKEHYGYSVQYRDFIIYFDPFNIEKAC